MENWLVASAPIIIKTIISVVLILVVMLVVVRVGGLRTFAKMSSIDFATTVAIGSILASVVISTNTSILKGSVALATIVVVQQLFSHAKLRFDAFEEVAENQPILLMRGPNILRENLEKTGVTHADLMAKLREANVIAFSEIKAVVLETTGDISVLHGSDDTDVDDRLLAGVKS